MENILYYSIIINHYNHLVNEITLLWIPLNDPTGAIETGKNTIPSGHANQLETTAGQKGDAYGDASSCVVCDVFVRQYRFYPICNNLSHCPEVLPASLEKKHLMHVAFPLFDPHPIAQGFHIEAAGNAIPCQNLDF